MHVVEHDPIQSRATPVCYPSLCYWKFLHKAILDIHRPDSFDSFLLLLLMRRNSIGHITQAIFQTDYSVHAWLVFSFSTSQVIV